MQKGIITILPLVDVVKDQSHDCSSDSSDPSLSSLKRFSMTLEDSWRQLVATLVFSLASLASPYSSLLPDASKMFAATPKAFKGQT